MALPKMKPVPLAGPPPMPIVGMFGNMLRVFRDPVAALPKLTERYGRVAALAKDNPMMVYALGPEYNQLLLSDAHLFHTVDATALFSIKPDPDSAVIRLANAVTLENGPRHVAHRKLMMPALHRNALPIYREQMIRSITEIIDRWSPGETLDIFKQMQTITLRTALRTLLGIEPDHFGGADLGALYQQWMKLASSIPMLIFPINLPGSPYRRLLKLSEQLLRQTLEVIEHKRRNPGPDVLSMLVSSRDEEGTALSEAELIGNTHVLFIIGHQTMTDVLTWTLFLLSQHPDVLHAIGEEIDGVLRGAPPTFENLDKLKLLNFALDETLRLLGPTIWQFRVAQKPFALGSVEMPEKSWMIFSPHFTHRLPEIFPDPNRYVPRRWETAKPSPFEYLPFTFGPHGCIGPNFAYMEMKIVLSLVLQRYRPALAKGAMIDRATDPTLIPKNGMPMKLLPVGARHELNRPAGNINEMVEFA